MRVQQGDPLDPLLFSLSIHKITLQLLSVFSVFYLDNSTCLEDVFHGPNIMENITEELGLQLNRATCEVICSDPDTLGKFFWGFPGLARISYWQYGRNWKH